MNEQIIVKGKFSENKIARILFISAAIALIIGLIAGIASFYSQPADSYIRENYNVLSHIISNCLNMGHWFGLWYIGAVVLVALGFLYRFMLGNCEITVSDKRVWGKTSFGKRVDLPFNQISAVAYGNFGSVSVGTASGHVSFWYLENKYEIHDAIADVLVKQQNNATTTTTIKQEIPQSNADELKKFKELLDMGIITQEEFDAKKKQLLGL